MQHLSGLILDYYDAPDRFPDAQELMKVASLEPQELAALPDHLFALVLTDGRSVLRKFACQDAAHTAVSAGAFLHTAGTLPDGVQKLAAANIVNACAWYDLTPPADLVKVALGLGTVMTGAQLAMDGPTAVKSTSARLKQNSGFGGAIIGSGQRVQ